MVEQHIIEYQPEGSSLVIDVSYRDDEFWFTTSQAANLFGVALRNIQIHIKNILDEASEVYKEATTKKYFAVQKEGRRYVGRELDHYSIEIIIEIASRLRKSELAWHIRQWSKKVTSKLARDGYVIDEERLASGDVAYYNEITARLRAIRRSETLLFEKARDILATSIDYNSKSKEAKYFFASVQNKLHYAVTGHTAPELIHHRANHEKPNMGLVTWQGKNITKGDVEVAKNYLLPEEMIQLENLIDQFLLHGEFQLLRGRQMQMQDWTKAVDELIEFNHCEVLQDKGKRSREQANKRARLEYEKYIELMGGMESLKAYEQQVLAEIEEETRQYLKSQDEAEV